MSMPPDGLGREPEYDPYRETRPPRANPAQMAGVFLLILGIINLLLAGYLFLNTVTINMLSPADFEKHMLDSFARRGQAPPAVDWQNVQSALVVGFFVWTGISLIAAILIIVGSVKMMTLSSYALAITGAVLSMIPLVSCLCLGGQGIGIWALVVLLKPEVKALFR
jgi:ABC-type glycerol-3-phosphate transport system permease component